MEKSIYIKRKLEETILRYLNSPEIIAVVGPRQSGKTTLLYHVFNKLGGAISGNFISFEDRRILDMFEKDIDSFIEIYVKNKKYLFIDEFQYSKNGGKILKYIYDLHKIKIFLSGSSAIDLTVNAVKFLVGRIFVFDLYPLDFEEFVNYQDSNYSNLLKDYRKKAKQFSPLKISEGINARLLRYYEEFVLFGGYPRVVIADSHNEKIEILKNIYNTYFLREVRDILGLIDDYKLAKLIKALALQIGNLIEYKELSMLSEYNYHTLKKYLNFLEKTFICGFVKPYFKNKRIEIVKNPKVFFLDTGLRNFIINDFRKFDDRPDAGALLENAAFQQLVKDGYRINYWRTKKQYEIDFVLSLEEQKIAAMEVKNYLSKTSSASLNNFQKMYPEAKIVFVYRDVEYKIVKGNYLFYPIYVI